jgi:pimeloyl-ACP methyl ester carboxylesterase
MLRGARATVACVASPGRVPGVVFLGGYASDMTGTKALFLEARCRAAGRAFLRFDYRGHGASPGRFEDGTISAWTEDALLAVDSVAGGPVVLVGSSMGVWIALRVALARPDRAAGLVGIAGAPDFTQDLLPARLGPEAMAAIRRDGLVRVPSAYSDSPYVYTRALVEDGERARVLGRPIPFRGPVHLLHGMADPDVPWSKSLAVLEALEGADARLVLVKDGDHRLSRPQDLELIGRELDDVLAAVEAGAAPR